MLKGILNKDAYFALLLFLARTHLFSMNAYLQQVFFPQMLIFNRNAYFQQESLFLPKMLTQNK